MSNRPKNAREVRFDKDRSALRYELAPESREEKQAQADLRLAEDWKVENVPQLMASLTKVYSEHKIDKLWTARSVFHNSGSTSLTNFRVRFKIEGFSSWGQWHRTPVVYPNQTVVDGYFPVLGHRGHGPTQKQQVRRTQCPDPI